jgi:solute carrier family 13 (sodium-dependent dicarboxylate transporter), member 2/3/5
MSEPTPRERRTRLVITAVLLAVALVVPSLLVDDATQVRAATLAAVVLALWLGEALPPFVPTLLLVAAVPLVMSGDSFGVRATLSWCADPVLALFFGGFALGAAASKHGIDAFVARTVVRVSRGRALALVALACGGTALLSMWMSNIAAAAMMLAALRPIVVATMQAGARNDDGAIVRALLLAVAFGANFGGMATPIGSGPNAIALARAPGMTFIEWMIIAAPLTLGVLAAALVLIAIVVMRGRVRGRVDVVVAHAPFTRKSTGVMIVFVAGVAVWMSEPLHGVPAPVVALAAAAALFLTGLLDDKDLARIDWSTLLLVAGGLALGRLLETSGVIDSAARSVPWDALPQAARLVVIIIGAASFSALASNTATATMLIPLAHAIDPSPSMAILVAIGCSLGAPFVFSTPPNAMAVGAGARSRDLLLVGLPLMIGGALFVALTGPKFVAFFFR